jgi:AraC-like DNA-binding protein
MDLLAALLNYLSPSVKFFYSGASCETGFYDGKDSFGYMHLIKSGSMDVQVREKHCVAINTPTVLFFPQPCAHIMIPNAGAVELVCGKVDLGIREQSPLAISMPEFLAIPIVEMPAIGATLDLLYQEAFADGIGRQTALDRLLEYFLIHVLRHLIAQGKLSRGALAINAMHERPSHTWTLDKLADTANFHKLAGLPPLEYLTSWRLSVARGMLRQGRPLKSVAFAVGYQSPEAFGRVFAKKIGQSPSEWLRTQFSSTEVVN